MIIQFDSSGILAWLTYQLRYSVLNYLLLSLPLHDMCVCSKRASSQAPLMDESIRQASAHLTFKLLLLLQGEKIAIKIHFLLKTLRIHKTKGTLEDLI